MVSANTHFEEWWFKTFLSNITANAAVHMLKPSQFPIGSWFFCVAGRLKWVFLRFLFLKEVVSFKKCLFLCDRIVNL